MLVKNRINDIFVQHEKTMVWEHCSPLPHQLPATCHFQALESISHVSKNSFCWDPYRGHEIYPFHWEESCSQALERVSLYLKPHDTPRTIGSENMFFITPRLSSYPFRIHPQQRVPLHFPPFPQRPFTHPDLARGGALHRAPTVSTG